MVSKAVILLLLTSAVFADINKDFKAAIHGQESLNEEKFESMY